MKEKNKAVKQETGGNGDSVFDGAPDLPTNKNVNVSSGPYSENLPVAGKTIGEVRQAFSDRLDIDDEAQSIVNGKPQDETYLLSGGEALMFIRHAGEKGASKVVIEGDLAKANGDDFSMPVEVLCQRVGPGMSTGPCILPSGIKAVLSQGPLTIWIWEQPPRIHRLSWIREDSPAPYGCGATYRSVTIALPYLVIAAVFQRDGSGMPALLLKDECFFRNAPLKSLDDELSFPGLLNCSRWADVKNMGHPLSWICTQNLKWNPKMNSKDPGERLAASLEAVRYCLLETSFNLSSEHHEGNSWYGFSKKSIGAISTVEKWEKATEKNPLFVLELPWIKTGHTVRQLADRIFQQNGGSAGSPKTADDLARIIINQ